LPSVRLKPHTSATLYFCSEHDTKQTRENQRLKFSL
jgi:hypothetical protein